MARLNRYISTGEFVPFGVKTLFGDTEELALIAEGQKTPKHEPEHERDCLWCGTITLPHTCTICGEIHNKAGHH